MPAAGTILISTKQFVLWGHFCECVKRGDFGIRWLQCPDSASQYRHSHRRGKASYKVALVYLCIHLNFSSACACAPILDVHLPCVRTTRSSRRPHPSMATPPETSLDIPWTTSQFFRRRAGLHHHRPPD